jgi:hypothetical protein
MLSDEREALLKRTKTTCGNSRFLLGLISHQTPDLGPEAKAILARVDSLDRDPERRNPRSLIKRRHSIEAQVRAIGLRSKAILVGANS